MFTLVVTEQGGTERRQQFDKNEVTIGRVTSNDVVLPKGNISKRHSRIIKRDGSFIVVDIKSTNGTFLNGRRINSPERVNPGDKIYIGEFRLSIETEDQPGAAPPALEAQGAPPPLRPPSGPTSFEGQAAPAAPAGPPPGPPPMAPAAPPGPPVGPPPMANRPPSLPQSGPADLAPPPAAPSAPAAPPQLAPPPAQRAPTPSAPPAQAAPTPPPPAQAPPRAPTAPPPPQASATPSPSVPPPAAAPSPHPLEDDPTPPPSIIPAAPAKPQLGAERAPAPRAQAAAAPAPAAPAPAAPAPAAPQVASGIGAEVAEFIARLPRELDAFTTSAEILRDDVRRQKIESALSGENDALAYAAKAELTGLGALEALMADGAVQAIFADQQGVRVDRGQGVEKSGASVSSAKMLTAIAGRLLSGAGIDSASGTFSAGGFSVRAIRPPAASSAMIAMTRVLDASELVASGVLSSDQASTLDQAAKDGKQILVIGTRRNTDRLLGLFDAAGVDLDVGHGAIMSSRDARDVAVAQAQAYHDVVIVSGAAPGELAMLIGASVIGVTAKNLFAVRAVLGALGQTDLIGAFDLAVELDSAGRVANISEL